MDYPLSGEKFGFPLLKALPDTLQENCVKQDWCDIEVKSGLKEGKGVFAKAFIKKNTPLCNYGGVQVSRSYAEKYLLPYDDKCNYLIELVEKTCSGMETFYINRDLKREKTFGQLLNHSSRHPNSKPRLFTWGKGKLELIFFACREIKPFEEIVWDYGKHFSGVNPCVESCTKCTKG